VNTRGTIGATQQQQENMSRASVADRYSTPISFLNLHNYESLFNFWILYINVSKKEASNEMNEK
jgi:hypothetical protein